MKAGLLLSGSGALLYLTSHKKYMDDSLVKEFHKKGIDKFIAYEVPVEEAKDRYGAHYDIVMNDLNEIDDLRILDYDGSRVFHRFNLKKLKKPVIHE